MNLNATKSQRMVFFVLAILASGLCIAAAQSFEPPDRVQAKKLLDAARAAGNLDAMAEHTEAIALAELIDYFEASYELIRIHCQRGDEEEAFATVEAMLDAGYWDYRKLLGDEELESICKAIRSYDLAFEEEFGKVHDSFLLIGQDNLRRYLPVSELRVRVHPSDSAFELFGRAAAAKAAGARITVSYPHEGRTRAIEALEHVTEFWAGSIEFVEESDEELADIIRDGLTDRVRFAGRDRAPEVVLRAVGDAGVYIARAPVLAEGRIELLWYLREQSISFDYHRYGTLGDRATEERAETL